jgi:hydrogenase small subunit
MPFMDEPPGSKISSATNMITGGLMRTLRGFTEHTADQEPKWRHKGTRLDTGYDPPWRRG